MTQIFSSPPYATSVIWVNIFCIQRSSVVTTVYFSRNPNFTANLENFSSAVSLSNNILGTPVCMTNYKC